jgi:hypothetical protein
MALPPVVAGALQETVAEVCVALAATLSGGEGAGVAVVEGAVVNDTGAEAAEVPVALVAVTEAA